MSQQPVQLHLSAELYERLQRMAEHGAQPVEEVVIKSLELLYGATDLDVLERFSDKALWSMVRQRLGPQEDTRLDELIAHSKQADLTHIEQSEIESLLELEDMLTLARSRALALLKKRGHAIDQYLHAGS
jgi:hypothetical protein